MGDQQQGTFFALVGEHLPFVDAVRSSMLNREVRSVVLDEIRDRARRGRTCTRAMFTRQVKVWRSWRELVRTSHRPSQNSWTRARRDPERPILVFWC